MRTIKERLLYPSEMLSPQSYCLLLWGSGSPRFVPWNERTVSRTNSGKVFHIHDPRPADKLFAKVARRGVSAGGGGGKGKDFRGYDFPEGNFPSEGTPVRYRGLSALMSMANAVGVVGVIVGVGVDVVRCCCWLLALMSVVAAVVVAAVVVAVGCWCRLSVAVVVVIGVDLGCCCCSLLAFVSVVVAVGVVVDVAAVFSMAAAISMAPL